MQSIRKDLPNMLSDFFENLIELIADIVLEHMINTAVSPKTSKKLRYIIVTVIFVILAALFTCAAIFFFNSDQILLKLLMLLLFALALVYYIYIIRKIQKY